MMINNNVEDRIKMAKAIAQVRKMGCCNMFDRISVAEVLYAMGWDATADYISESSNRKDFLNLLKLSANY